MNTKRYAPLIVGVPLVIVAIVVIIVFNILSATNSCEMTLVSWEKWGVYGQSDEDVYLIRVEFEHITDSIVGGLPSMVPAKVREVKFIWHGEWYLTGSGGGQSCLLFVGLPK